MKRFTLIAMVVALVMVWAVGASAAELKARGQVQAWGRAMDNWDFVKSSTRWSRWTYEDDFTIEERARLFFDFIANENLKFVLQMQVGNGAWGQSGFGLGQGDAATGLSTSIRVRQAYLDFNVPDTKVNVKAGYLTATLPGYVGGSAILDDEVAAMLVTAPIIENNLSVLVGYARLWDSTAGNNTQNAATTSKNGYGMRDEFDAALLALPMKFDGIEAVPFFLYGWAGKDALNDAINAGGSATSLTGDQGRVRGLLSPALRVSGTSPYYFEKDITAWWLGLTGKVTMFDPIWAALGVNYGKLNGGGTPPASAGGAFDNNKVNDRSGWLVDFALGYSGLEMVKPKLFFAWTSGEDSDPTNGSERMPVLSNYLKYTPFYFGNSISSSSGTMMTNVAYANEHIGFWTIGLSLEKITFMKNLWHDFTVAYIQGTNSKDLLQDTNMVGGNRAWGGLYVYQPGHFLTTKDSLWEFDLNTTYKVYEQLSAVFEIGYIVQSINKDIWNNYLTGTASPGQGNYDLQTGDAVKFMFGLSYDF